MRGTFQFLVLGHLLIAGVGSACVPVRCLRCNCTEADACHSRRNTSCIEDAVYANISSSCKKGFPVSINTSGSNGEEGKKIKLECVHDLQGLVWLFGWKKDGKEDKKNQNKSKIKLKKAFAHHSGMYSCYVNSSCGYFESAPHRVKVENKSVIILIVCGVAALVLVVTMGLVLKYKLKRDNAKHRERMEMRNQEARTGGPDPITPRL